MDLEDAGTDTSPHRPVKTDDGGDGSVRTGEPASIPPDAAATTATTTEKPAVPWPELEEYRRRQKEAAERAERIPRWARLLTFLLAALIGFRLALLIQQATLWVVMSVYGCPDRGWDFGALGGKSSGITSCTGTEQIVAISVGLAVNVAMAGLLFWLFRTGHRPRKRFVALIMYMAALGAITEVMSVLIVFNLWDQLEGGDLRASGVPWWLLFVIGFAVFVIFAIPLRRSVPFFAGETLGRPDHQLKHFERAIWIKLTLGVIIISVFKVFIDSFG